jgi:hypothetical protein
MRLAATPRTTESPRMSVAPERRLQLLAGQLGNRRMARLVLARTVAAGALPAVGPAAVDVLTRLGLSEAQITAFRAGEIVLFNMAVPGHEATIGVLQLQNGLLRGGIFSIRIPNDPKLAVRAFAAVRDRVLDVARAVKVPEYELVGAAIHNSDIEAMLLKMKFVPSTEVLPESVGLGPNAQVEILSKRFPVGGGGTPTGGGPPPPPPPPPAAPPATPPPAAPPVPTSGAGAGATAAEGEVAGVAGKTATEAGGKAASDAVAAGLGFWRSMGLLMAASLLLEGAIAWLTYEKNVGDPKVLEFAGWLRGKLDLGLMQGIQAQAEAARKMTIDRPDVPVYAVLTYDLDYRWSRMSEGAAGIPGHLLNYVDARVVGVTLGRKNVSSDVVLSKAGPGDWRDRVDTRRITISLELNPLGESKQMRHWRAVSYDAGQVAQRGISARKAVESMHFDIKLTVEEEREERRRAKTGGTPIRVERERQEQLLWVAAYIDHTSIHGPKKLYDEAIAFYTELEQLALPGPGCQLCKKPTPRPQLVPLH